MPIPNCCSGTIDSVQKEIYIYKKITFDRIQNARTDEYSLFWNVDMIKPKPIKIVRTNNLDFYQVELDTGNYSGFVKYDNSTLFNNVGNSDGQLGEMLIVNTIIQQRNFDIDFEKSE